MIEEIKIKYDNIDCLINCAGMLISGDMSKLELPIFDQMNDLSRIRKVIDTEEFCKRREEEKYINNIYEINSVQVLYNRLKEIKNNGSE